MATTTIEARCNARPTRLAFILSEPDRDQLTSVIARASTLWGGIFNPIVILDDSARKTAGIHYTLATPDPYLKLQSNMLMAFDPDLLITYSTHPLPSELRAWEHRTFSAERLDWSRAGRNSQPYFVDIFPLLNDLWEKEFKYARGSERPKIKFVEKVEAEKSLYTAARFGLYANDDYYEFLRENFNAEAFAFDAESKQLMHWPAEFQSLLGLTALYCWPSRRHIQSYSYFLLNPEDPFDVVDYWNLRAAGKHLFPVTLDDYRECETAIRDFGAASAYPINDRITNHATIIKAASITDEELLAVTEWISENGLAKDLARQGWVPHYHKGGYGVVSELNIGQVRGFELSVVGILVEGHGRIDGPKPTFLSEENFLDHWSMDMSFSTFRTPDACYKLPWLNVGCDELVSRRIGLSFSIDAARVSLGGIVTRQHGNSGDVRISPISAVEVVKAFLQGTGIEYLRISSPGLALNRIIEMMDGFHNCEIFQNPAIRETLEELSNGDHRLATAVASGVVRSLQGYRLYGQLATQQQKCARAQDLLNRTIETNVFRVGLVFQCSRCQRYNWYSVTQFDKQYNCKSCFSREETPRLDTKRWYYASDGLFRSANKLDGNITILLTLAFFDDVLDRDIKFAPSFDYKLNGEQHEMDFAIIANKRSRPDAEVIFGESKTGMALMAEERRKLRLFGGKTGAYLCFCTLSDDFDFVDKEFFKELYEADVKIIMLPRFFLEMDAHELSTFRMQHNPGRSTSEADWLMRLTIIRTLGDEFARKHNIWL